MVEFTNKIIHVPGHLNIVADLMFRPPQAVPAPGAAMAASVKAPSGSLAVSQVAGGTAGAFSLLGAVVAAAENVDLEQLAAAQTHCPSIAQLQHIPVKSTPEGQQLRLCDTSTLAEKRVSRSPIFCTSRHQSFWSTSLLKNCVERHGHQHRQLVLGVYSLPES